MDWQAIGAFAGPAFSSAAGAYAQKQTNDTQLKLSRTAHQREVNDLRAAGLNPILSAGGKGAPMPSLDAPSFDLTPAVNSALAARMNNAQLEQIHAQTGLTSAQAVSQQSDNAVKLQTQEQDIWLKKLQLINSGLDRESKQVGVKMLQSQLEQLDTQKQLLRLSLPEASAKAEYFRGPGGKLAPFHTGVGSLLNSAKAGFDAFWNYNSEHPRAFGFGDYAGSK